MLAWTHCEPAVVPCAYLVRHTKTPCSKRITRKNCAAANLLFASLLDILDAVSGIPGDTNLLSDVLDGLAKVLICVNHSRYDAQAGNQWLREFVEKGVAVQFLSTLNELYGVGTALYSEEDSAEEDSEEDNSVLSIQSSSTVFTRCTPDVHESVVANKVTKLLERTLGVTDKQAGHIYVFSTNTPEMFKIGYSKNPPRGNRLRAHKACYPVVDEIMAKCIPYARRVEQLVLAEFRNVRCKLAKDCQKCKSSHGEWLKIDQETLLASVDKWIAFAETYPYQPNGRLYKNTMLPPPASSRNQGGGTHSTPTKGRRQSSQLGASASRLKSAISTAKSLDSDENEAATDQDESDSENCESASHKKFQDSIASVSAQFKQMKIARQRVRAMRQDV